MIWIGTSGWVYEDWSERFYPSDLAEGDWLPFYANEFPTVEINRSYYRLPTRDQFHAWAEQSPPGFRFAVKASRYLTHMKKLRAPEDPLERLTDAAAGLGDRLGPYLYQLPPRWHANPERLAHFVSILPARQRAAFEFRDPSWHTPEVFDILAAAGCGLAIGVHGSEPSPDEAPRVGPFRFVRFHRGGRDIGFSDAELRPWVDRLAADANEQDVYVYFNNDPAGHAIADARRLREMLRDSGAKAATSAQANAVR